MIYEIACAWEPLIEDRQREKGGKYLELAADLATQWPGWKVQTTPLVVGDLGSQGRALEAAAIYQQGDPQIHTQCSV